MLVSCSHCSARVNGEVVDSFPVFEGDGPVMGYRISLLSCPACSKPIVAKQELVGWEEEEGEFSKHTKAQWSDARRVWPDPESGLDASIPQGVQVSLSEAKGCLLGGNYTASVVMSGRALEAVARHFHVGEKAQRLMLARGLEELHGSGKIDERLFQWGKELHEHRNLAAHATDRTFSREDAEDLYEFVSAICEYLFVLQDRYDRFMQRKERHKKLITHDPE
jgi:hypothetical protein